MKLRSNSPSWKQPQRDGADLPARRTAYSFHDSYRSAAIGLGFNHHVGIKKEPRESPQLLNALLTQASSSRSCS